MKSYLFILLSLFCFTVAKSQVEVTNNYSKPIYVAIAFYESNSSFSGWVSEGWWLLEPGDTKVLGSFLTNGENTFYIHAHTSDSKESWGTDIQLAVNVNESFRIKNCDKAYVLSGDVSTLGFSKRFVHIGLLEMYRAYVTIG
jgi:uncharacterized membrane protein